jgi:hypothetical protein
MPIGPPIRLIGVQSAAMSVDYEVVVQTPYSRQTLSVSKAVYDKVRPGTRAAGEMWRGYLLKVNLGGSLEEHAWIAALFPIAWSVGWAGMALMLGALMFPLVSFWEHDSYLPGVFKLTAAGIAAFLVLHFLFEWDEAWRVVPAVLLLGVVVYAGYIRSGRGSRG